MGNTWVLATASVEEKVPPFLEGKKTGWITAEYSMLPRATHTRKRRESTAGRPDGRSQEIQRLIGRALRACIDTTLLGERTITIDCDVIQADGGTRIASINGGFVALAFAVRWLAEKKKIATSPVKSAVAGISVAMKSGEVLVDPDYDEDSTCDVDMNLVMLEGGRLVELQGTGEGGTFSPKESQEMLQRAMPAISKVIELQRNVCG
jgi:ribonuclease PH